MTDDPNRKTLRQFQCRDYLWDVFEVMSRELQCSVDYLINESMRHYARSQGRLRPGSGPATRTGGGPALQSSGAPPGMNPMRAPTGIAPPPGMSGAPGRAPGPPPPMRPPMGTQQPGYGAPVARGPGGPPAMPGMQGSSGAPPRPAAPPYPPNGVAAGSTLYAVFEGQKYPIAKEEFFIGRSNKSCDLVVKDPNVSRQHARIVRHNGQFWMVDMGSTNGIEFQGTRVDRRPIGEGDTFKICDHEIVFTYR